MGELAARTIFANDTGPLAGAGLDTLAKNQGAILELEGAAAPQSKTITDGSISPTAAYVIVDTEGSAAADDLGVISPVLSASENLHDGMIIYLRAADSGRVVTVKNSSSANGINTYDGNDYVLSTTHWLKLQLRSGKWYEVEGRAMETALAAATAAAAASTPATTTARGIGRVATSADLVDGATINNGPAFLAAGVHTSVTAAAGKVPVADSNGKLDAWVSQQTQYATCATAAATAEKNATLTGFSLVKGARVFVTFSNPNTVAGALTLNVNNTGAKSIYNELGAVSSSNQALFPAGRAIEFIYDGTNWVYQSIFISNPKKVALLASRTTSGTWTIAGVTPDVPLKIYYEAPAADGYGAVMRTQAATGLKIKTIDWVLGVSSGYVRTNEAELLPNAGTVSVEITSISTGTTLYAYQ